MVVNIILVILILALAVFGIVFVYQRYSTELGKDTNEIVNTRITPEYLIDAISKTFTGMLQEDLDSLNLSQEEYDEREKLNVDILTNKKEASNGNPEAKAFMKRHISNIIQHESVGVNAKNINQIIHFDNEAQLTGKDKFQILLYYYKKKYGDIKKGFDHLMCDNRLNEPICLNPEAPRRKKYRYIVDNERIGKVYEKISKNDDFVLQYADKLDIVTQRLFEMYDGLNSADLLLEAGVDEVDGGVSQIPKKGFVKKLQKGMKFSYETIWIVYQGCNIQMECLPFDTQKELERVVNNIYKYKAPYPLNESDGYVACSMWDGTRVVVMMPPFSEDYAFFARKHDSAPGIEPEILIQDTNCRMVCTTLYWLIMGQKNAIISGQQGTGKTTIMKSLLYYMPETINIRINEMIAELGLRYAYPYRNTLAVQQTATISMQEALDILKKTNGMAQLTGEIAEASQTKFFVQQAQKGSVQAMATHHAKSSKELIPSLAQDLLEEGVYQTKEEAQSVVAEVVNFDIHLTNTKGHRHIEYINEIIPVKGNLYPVEAPTTSEDAVKNELEYYKRITDREFFRIRPIIEYDKKLECFVLKNLPSDKTLEDIESKLVYDDDIREFHEDMEELRKYIGLRTCVDPATSMIEEAPAVG